MYHILFNHSSVIGHLGCFYVVAKLTQHCKAILLQLKKKKKRKEKARQKKIISKGLGKKLIAVLATEEGAGWSGHRRSKSHFTLNTGLYSLNSIHYSFQID